MKFRTNRERDARKLKKDVELREQKVKDSKQVHVTFHRNPGYQEIINSVKTSISYVVTRNAHAKRGIERVVLAAKILWTTGTYILSKHGKLGKQKS